MFTDITKINEIANNSQKELMQWFKRNKCSTIAFNGWDSKLWNKPYDEIVEFIINRFEKTLDEVEYYNCIIYLWKHVEPEYLFVPFSESYQIIGKTHKIKKLKIVRSFKQNRISNIKVRGA